MAGGDHEGPWILPNILVNVRRSADGTSLGVVRELLPVWAFHVILLVFNLIMKWYVYVSVYSITMKVFVGLF